MTETQPQVYQLLLIFSSDVGTWCKEWLCLLYSARRLTCQPRDWGWQCPLLSSDYSSAGKATIVFGTCWSLIRATALYTEMKNIWSAHTLYLDWLHKCMGLYNPDQQSYFSLFWSISCFVFNHIRQPAGQFPGGLSQKASHTACPPAQVSLPPPHSFARMPCIFPASLPEQWELLPTDQLWKLVEFLKCKELVQAVCWACLLLGFFLSDSVSLPAGRAELTTLSPQLQERLPVP